MKLFERVHCKGYLKKVNDGVHIQIFNPDGTFCDAKTVDSADYKAIAYKEGVKPNGLSDPIEIKDLSEWDGDSVEKIYRERTEEEFDGFLVGVTRVKVSGRIGTDWECVNYGFGDIREYGHCFKTIDEYPKVGVVYFKNNCKRYVLMEDMEIIE
mgnify:CR=1 FL=1